MAFLWTTVQYIFGIFLIILLNHFVFEPRKLRYKISKLDDELRKRQIKDVYLQRKLEEEQNRLEEKLLEANKVLEQYEMFENYKAEHKKQMDLLEQEIVDIKNQTEVVELDTARILRESIVREQKRAPNE